MSSVLTLLPECWYDIQQRQPEEGVKQNEH
jgi:hypothetical protein